MAATVSGTTTATCLCKKVVLRLKTPTNGMFGACHCGMCRKWGGGPFLEVSCGADVSIESGKDSITVFDSSAWAERGFCSHCGTHLFYRLKHDQSHEIPLGLLDDEGVASRAKFDMQVFIDKKPANYTFANETKTMTEQAVFEMYAPPESDAK
jgi:hypothetical protein